MVFDNLAEKENFGKLKFNFMVKEIWVFKNFAFESLNFLVRGTSGLYRVIVLLVTILEKCNKSKKRDLTIIFKENRNWKTNLDLRSLEFRKPNLQVKTGCLTFPWT